MRKLLLTLLAVFLVAPPALAADKPLIDLFKEQNPRTYAVLDADFPQDLRALTTRLAELDQPNLIALQQLSFTFEALKQIRRKHADRLLYAPPQALSAVLAYLADFYDAVLEGEGAATCGVFAQDGSAVLFSLGKSAPYAELIDRQSAAFLDAVAKAIETPEFYGAVEKEDMGELLGTMVGAGAPQSYVVSIAGGDAADPELCPALSSMFRLSAVLDTPAGLRARADLARNVSGY